jgi:hypothetical protein
MDHTHWFTCGGDLDKKIARIDRVKDGRLYGLFPAFVPRIREEIVEAAIARLQQLKKKDAVEVVDSIPDEWEIRAEPRRKLTELIVGRASFVAWTILPALGRQCWPGSFYDPG